MSDNRKVSTDALETLGTFITDNEKRDAIHLAVIPVRAGDTLTPGHHIFIKDGTAYPCAFNDGVGIVDPFLVDEIQTGTFFWCVIYPRKITSLRHVWSHPDFPEEETKFLESPIKLAQHWLEKFADDCDISYDELMEGASAYAKSGEYLHMGDNEKYKDRWDDMTVFWGQYEIVTGETVDTEKRGDSFFSCSC